jgi:hypothetical protein
MVIAVISIFQFTPDLHRRRSVVLSFDLAANIKTVPLANRRKTGRIVSGYFIGLKPKASLIASLIKANSSVNQIDNIRRIFNEETDETPPV